VIARDRASVAALDLADLGQQAGVVEQGHEQLRVVGLEPGPDRVELLSLAGLPLLTEQGGGGHQVGQGQKPGRGLLKRIQVNVVAHARSERPPLVGGPRRRATARSSPGAPIVA
jgi:hypothetical protein